ncbi:MAG: transposase [Deltaproteobacteria bacterium]
MNKRIHQRKNLRLRHYDYDSDGYYFVTICTAHKKPLICQHKGVVKKILHNLVERFPGLQLDYYALMDDHLHLILAFKGVNVHLGEVIRTFKALVKRETCEKEFWQRNYYEHVIRNEKALNSIREYIRNNPMIERIRFEEFYERETMGRDKSRPYR